jgi:oligopeptide/dipeptide ABC transporter ATP-binding protein
MLTVSDLSVSVDRRDGVRVKLVNDVSFTIPTAGTFALVGESGAGKSLTVSAVVGILAKKFHVDGDIDLDGQPLLTLKKNDFRRIRGAEMFMVPQAASTSLNPSMTIFRQLKEMVADRSEKSREAVREQILSALSETGIRDVEKNAKAYPHQLSGGMRQRVVLAMALLSKPRLLIADEPTSALDVLTQEGVLKSLSDLQSKHGMSLLFVTHDLRAAARVCTHIGVMYRGRMVEQGPIADVFRHPIHPYTSTLVDAISGATSRATNPRDVAPRVASAEGCPFAARCSRHLPLCDQQFPPAKDWGDGRLVHCWNPEIAEGQERSDG